MTTEDRTEQLRKIRDEVWNLSSSPLYEERKKNRCYPVLGQGSHHAEVVFIGEAPGRNEAKTGVPFCGAAGKILDELLASVNIPREDVYITNILKDRPPENRDPLPNEIDAYAPFLLRQLAIIQPKVIVTLGRFSTQFILEKFKLGHKAGSIGKLHGTVFIGRTSYGEINILPMYHPAASIYKPPLKETLLEDFKILENLLKRKTPS